MLIPSRSWVHGLIVGLTLGAVLGAATTSRGTAGRNEATLEAMVAALEALAQDLVRVDGTLDSLNGPDLLFEGVNVHIRSGSGLTDDGGEANPEAVLTGLGNLIIGYNRARSDLGSGARSGSHTVVVGDFHRYTKWAGVVAGFDNAVTGPAATAFGSVNTATGFRRDRDRRRR
jgi:hypothetical protein